LPRVASTQAEDGSAHLGIGDLENCHLFRICVAKVFHDAVTVTHHHFSMPQHRELHASSFSRFQATDTRSPSMHGQIYIASDMSIAQVPTACKRLVRVTTCEHVSCFVMFVQLSFILCRLQLVSYHAPGDDLVDSSPSAASQHFVLKGPFRVCTDPHSRPSAPSLLFASRRPPCARPIL
jgi:hypothetical protein